MKFTHWSHAPVTLDKMWTYPQDSRHMKPKGLWFSVDGDWERWCEDEQFGADRLKVAHVVEFDPDRVLFLGDGLAIDRFTIRYIDRLNAELGLSKTLFLDWAAVTLKYAGIVIAPYCWERRLSDDTFWYYGWDCASGCIWDLSVVTRFEVTDVQPRVVTTGHI